MFNFFKSRKKQNEELRSAIVTENISQLSLYYYPNCPYCRMVLRQIELFDMDIELRDIHGPNNFKKELVSGGGRKTVPCLKIEQHDQQALWMYESRDIADFIKETYS